MTIYPPRQSYGLLLRFMGGIVLALAITLLIFVALMRPPLDEFQAMTLFLSATSAISVIAGFVAYRFGWLQWSPRLSWTLMSSYVLAAVLTFLNVWWTARLMFINPHDLTLATILLIFAAGIALALGYFLSTTITDKIAALSSAAETVAHGKFSTRVEIAGRDEMAQLADSFNSMAAQLERADRKQKELDRLRRDLIAWVGHDLRTPLGLRPGDRRGVWRTTSWMTRKRRRAICARLNVTLALLSALIDDLFDMAQMDAGGLRLERSPNAISDLISDTLESFSSLAAEHNVMLTGMAAPGVDPVYIDARQIGRVLNNLVSNAVRHTPPGGKVTVHTYPVRAGVVVEVTDTGEGIRPEDISRIFEQFYRGEKSRSRATGGAGLGLAIANAIVEAHGGDIQVDSRPGEGARFRFTLPRDKSALAGHPLARRLRSARPGTDRPDVTVLTPGDNPRSLAQSRRVSEYSSHRCDEPPPSRRARAGFRVCLP